jgi:hypothetical protein
MADRYAVANGNWSDTATWDGGTLPGASDDVYADGYTVTIDQDVTVLSIRTSQRSGGTNGGSFSVSATGLTITADLHRGTNVSCLVFSGIGILNIVGSTQTAGTGSDRYFLQVTGGGAVDWVGNITGSGANRRHGVNLGSGTLTVTGTVTGGEWTNAAGVYLSGGTLTIIGDVVAATGPAVECSGSGNVVVVEGELHPSADAPAVNMHGGSTSAGDLILSGNVNDDASGTSPTFFGRLLIDSSAELTHTYRTDNSGTPGVARSLYTGGVNLGQPVEADVRDGTTFGASSEYTGSLAVPDPSYVSQGVPTDNTVGTMVSGGSDWTDTEKEQIRYRLGIDGTESAPATNTDQNLTVTVGTNNDKTGYALTSGERDSIAAAVAADIINDGDGTAVLQAIADQIAADWVAGDASPLAIVSAIKADATLAAMISRIDENVSAAKTLTVAERSAIVSAITGNASIAAMISRVDENVSAAKTLTAAERIAVGTAVASDILNDADGTAVLQAIADQIAADWIAGDASPLAIVSAIKADATLATMISRIDATVSSRQASGNVTVGDIVTAALAKFASTDTGEASAASGSVAALSQGAGGGGGGDASEANQLSILAALSGKVIKVTSRTVNGNELVSYIGDDDVDDNAQSVVIDDVGEVIKTKLQAATSVSFGAGLDSANEVVGTIDTGNITHASNRTTIPVEITSANKPTKANPNYEWHIKSVDGDGNEFVEVIGTLDLRPERRSL